DLPSWLGTGQRWLERVGWWPRLLVVGLAAAALPLLGLGGFQLQVGIDALVIALLAVGLNIVVGWAGLLDLGYIAFFGFGAYGFALLSSAQLGSAGIHLQAWLSIPIVMIGAAILVLGVGLPSLRLLEYSRTGRAWRAVREDPLAAASMTIPVNRVKLSAFACGAMVAALAGTIYAAQQASVFPTDFDTPILILVYAGLILGGSGSIAGAATGALVVMVIYDGLLRSPAEASVL